MPSLTPTGTARSIFLGRAVDPDEALPDDLRAVLSGHDISDEILWAAWEVTTWVPGAPPGERRALGCLVVALLDAVDAGGTFLPVGPQNDGARFEALAGRLHRLGFGDADRHAAGALGDRLVEGTAAPGIAALVGVPGTRCPFILSNGGLYPERFWCLEERLVAMLRTRLASTPAPFPGSVDVAIAAIASDKWATPLAAEQLACIRAALTSPLTIIAGAPGTGKTSTVVGLLRTLVRLGVPPEHIALAAPTGRAASRMTESVNATLARLESPSGSDAKLSAEFTSATTLHRLLGIHPGRLWALGPENLEFYSDWPLPHRFVIVDEASMIDLPLMDQLVAAVAPETRLILIGDVDQLPSVQVGAVFRDLVAGVPQGITRVLTRSHRMNPSDPDGAEILRVAASVNAPASDFNGIPVRQRAADLTFAGFERLAPYALDAFLDRWHRDILAAGTNLPLALDGRHALDDVGAVKSFRAADSGDTDRPGNDDGAPGFGHHPHDGDPGAIKKLLGTLSAARIMCVTREAGRATSAAGINRLMHARVQAAAVAHGASESLTGAAFIPGEPVIVLRNDHTRGLFNGDVGVVLRLSTSRGARLGVAFDRGQGYVVHALDAIADELALAFALTVHKAQGSEYDRVAFVLPDIDGPLLTREVVYTALTRARRSVVVVGDPALFALAITRTLDRTSGIAAKLAGSAPPPA